MFPTHTESKGIDRHMNIQTIWSNILQFIGRAWWVKITTDLPNCTYYFGPFATMNEADTHQLGYIEDLESEFATGIHASIERCHPAHLTIDY